MIGAMRAFETPTLQALLQQREPVYAEADITVLSDAGPQETVVKRVLSALEDYGGALK